MRKLVCIPFLLLLLFSCATRYEAHSNRIDFLEKVKIGGMDQYVSIRGDRGSLPILLWLHGGPGSSQMPLAHEYDHFLEENFIVVHWDQRGAGKSNPKDFDVQSMTQERFVRDCHELTGYLQARFPGKPLVLLGHSWGSQLGIQVASLYPSDYLAYIGVSQVVDSKRAQLLGEQWLKKKVLEADSSRDMRALDELGPAPYPDHDDFVRFIKLVDAYGGGFDTPFTKLAVTALSSPYYSLKDLGRWIDGSNRGSGPMWEATQNFCAMTDVPRLDVPVLFICGKNDYNTPCELVEGYCQLLTAPLGKALSKIEGAAHTPFLKEPELFSDTVYEFYLSVLN